MNGSVVVEKFRVTSVPRSDNKLTIFTGVPLAENSYRVANGKYVVSVKAPSQTLPVQPKVGQHWIVTGEKSVDSLDCGGYLMQQFVFNHPASVECSLPESGEQLIKFIASDSDFRGIGEAKARALWDAHGTELYIILKVDSANSREALGGLLTEDSIDALFDGFSKYSNLEYCNWMARIGIPSSIQQRIIRNHGQKTIDEITLNPYLLIGFGASFGLVDNMASIHFLIESDDPRRLTAALESALVKEVSKGHTFTTESSLRPHLRQLLNDNRLIDRAFSLGASKAQYLRNISTGHFHPTAQFLMETVVAKRFLNLAENADRFIVDAEVAFKSELANLPYELTDKQRVAVLSCLDSSISCITGGAGTGKTTVLRMALRTFNAMGYEINAVALSGRAAMRLHESIGFSTKTIARMLRGDPIEPTSDIPKKLLVIDEASMLDLPTMYKIVNHLHPDVRIIFAGDPNQLPPIGCGKILSDIVESEVITNTTLDIVKRQDGSTGIPEYSRLINEGIVPQELTTGNVTFYEASDDKIVEVCSKLYEADPANSRVMGATKNTVGAINLLIQNNLNPNGEKMVFEMNGDVFYRSDLREGDTVLFTKNHYDIGVQNGSLGTLTSVDHDEAYFGEVLLDTNEKVAITKSLMECMEPGYCITLHKGQGSQWPRIIIALQPSRIVDRAWLYTAITRAETEVHIVGDSAVFKRVTQATSNAHKRNSHLLDLLKTGKRNLSCI
jgi:exodeoxyribonuclease V alpha subunit